MKALFERSGGGGHHLVVGEEVCKGDHAVLTAAEYVSQLAEGVQEPPGSGHSGLAVAFLLGIAWRITVCAQRCVQAAEL